MVSKEEEIFLRYWEANRNSEKKKMRLVFIGISGGLLLGAGILVLLVSGWYVRANMEANSEFNPVILIIAILAIALFCGIFYKKFKWDMNEQRYREILNKKHDTDSGSDAAK